MLQGKPIISYILDTVKNIFEDIVIVVKDKQQVDKVRQLTSIEKIIYDGEKDSSPIIGITRGIMEIKNNSFFLIACDMPFIREETIAELIEFSKKYDSVISFSDRYQPFCAVYKKELFNDCNKFQSMMKIIESSNNTKTIKFHNYTEFFNINTPIDLKDAKIFLRNADYKK